MNTDMPAVSSRLPGRIRHLRALGLLALLAGLTGLAGCSYNSEGDARWQARKAVRAKLMSPGSAKLVNDGVVAHTQDHAYYLVYVVMDSQNRLGAILRTHHLALMRTHGPEQFAQSVTIKSYDKPPPMSEAKEFQFMGTGWVSAAAPPR